jgi:tight adherence protein B
MLIGSALAFFVVIFLLASITVAVAWMGFLKTKAEQSDAARRDRETAGAGDDPASAAVGIDEDSPLFRTERLSTIDFLDGVLARFDFIEIMKLRIGQADLNWSVGRFTTLMLLCGTVALAVLLRLLPTWVALVGAIAVAFVPYGYILGRRNRRFHKFREFFPDVLDSVARALRAGYAFSAAMEVVTAEIPPPVSGEMRKTAAEANLGMGWPRALENLGQRVPLLEVNLFVAAVQLHSRTGGKLSEVMGSLAENMRESFALQGEIRSLSAHGKLTGVILTILPIGIALMMMIVSPGYMTVLVNHPWGKNLITGAIVCLVLAHLVIRKIVDIKV